MKDTYHKDHAKLIAEFKKKSKEMVTLSNKIDKSSKKLKMSGGSKLGYLEDREMKRKSKKDSKKGTHKDESKKKSKHQSAH